MFDSNHGNVMCNLIEMLHEKIAMEINTRWASKEKTAYNLLWYLAFIVNGKMKA